MCIREAKITWIHADPDPGSILEKDNGPPPLHGQKCVNSEIHFLNFS